MKPNESNNPSQVSTNRSLDFSITNYGAHDMSGANTACRNPTHIREFPSQTLNISSCTMKGLGASCFASGQDAQTMVQCIAVSSSTRYSWYNPQDSRPLRAVNTGDTMPLQCTAARPKPSTLHHTALNINKLQPIYLTNPQNQCLLRKKCKVASQAQSRGVLGRGTSGQKANLSLP